MKRIIILLLAVVGCMQMTWAQNTIEVSGQVTDAAGDPLIGANVIVKNAKGLGVITEDRTANAERPNEGRED